MCVCVAETQFEVPDFDIGDEKTLSTRQRVSTRFDLERLAAVRDSTRGGGGGNGFDEDTVESLLDDEDEDGEHGGGGGLKHWDGKQVPIFEQNVSNALTADDRLVMQAHQDFLEANNFHQLHHFWIRSSNLRGNLVDSIPYAVLKDVMLAMLVGKPSMLWGATEQASGSFIGNQRVDSSSALLDMTETGNKVARILKLLMMTELDVIHTPLTEETTVASLVQSIWGQGREMLARPTIIVVSSHSVLRQSVEYALIDMLRNGTITAGRHRFMQCLKGGWLVFVAASVDVGFSSWIRRECLIATHLVFGKPVGGLKPEISLQWIEKHQRILATTLHHDVELARWTRDVISLVRLSPYLQGSLPAGIGEHVQLCAKAAALIQGRLSVLPSDYRSTFLTCLRHHLVPAKGSPYSVAEIFEASAAQFTITM